MFRANKDALFPLHPIDAKKLVKDELSAGICERSHPFIFSIFNPEQLPNGA